MGFDKNILTIGIFGMILTTFFLIAKAFSFNENTIGNVIYFTLVLLMFLVSLSVVIFQIIKYTRQNQQIVTDGTVQIDIENKNDQFTETDPLIIN